MNFQTLFTDSGIVGFVILVMGIVGLALIVERVRVLYFSYSLKVDDFMSQLKPLVLGDKIEEAITFCSANSKKPLPHVIKGVLARSDRDDEGINQGLDIALSEVIPNLGKRLGYLSMLANVATLTGLLGTIQGLIMSFAAVADADPSQKQAVLAQGISLAMNTTFLGLAVAIPIMMSYSFLHARQNRLLEEIAEHSAKVVDWLTTRHYTAFSGATAFPTDIANDALLKNSPPPPPPNASKAS